MIYVVGWYIIYINIYWIYVYLLFFDSVYNKIIVKYFCLSIYKMKYVDCLLFLYLSKN